MTFKFLKYLTDSVLLSIDKEIELEVLPFVKVFGMLPAEIQTAATEAAETLDPITFVVNLKAAWEAHNRVAFGIDEYLRQIYSGERSMRDPWAIRRSRELLVLAFDVEDRKRIYSAGVKLAVTRYTEMALERYHLSEDDLQVLLTLSTLDYWTFYRGEHIKYIYADRYNPGAAESLKQQLLSTFHADEELVFQGRLRRDFSDYDTRGRENLLTELDEYEMRKVRARESEIRSCYLCAGRPELRYMQMLIRYDNLDEYLFGVNLYGIPDLFLRRLAIETLIEKGVVERRAGVLFYTKDDLLNGFDQIRAYF